MNRYHQTEALHTERRSNIMIIIVHHPRMSIADAYM